jgi:hypothetical protein
MGGGGLKKGGNALRATKSQVNLLQAANPSNTAYYCSPCCFFLAEKVPYIE